MKKYILAAALGSAMIVAAPAFASTSPYSFDFTGGSSNNDNLLQYGPVANGGTAGAGVTATAEAVYYSVGTGGSFTNSNGSLTGKLNSGDLGQYGGAGLGACETTGANCNPPLHQIDNGTNGISANNSYEFVLIKFSSAVDLTSIQLGNFGDGNADPFNITYYTSTSMAASLALAGTTLGSGNSFSTAQSESSQTLCGSTNGTCQDNMTGAATDGVTYLLIGASIADNGTDYFKIQDINASLNTGGSGSSGTPEPATFGMIGLALAGLGIYGRKRKSSNS
jgi:hypothetical protein